MNLDSVKQNKSLSFSNLLSMSEVYYYHGNINLAKQYYEMSKQFLDKSDEYFIMLDNLFRNYYASDDISGDETEKSIITLLNYQFEKNNHLVPLNQLHKQIECFVLE